MVCKVTKTRSTDLYVPLLNKYMYYLENSGLVSCWSS